MGSPSEPFGRVAALTAGRGLATKSEHLKTVEAVRRGVIRAASARRASGRHRRRPASVRVHELRGDARRRAVPTLKDSFVGYYRWHSKRTLREIECVRAIEEGGHVIAVSMYERLAPEVGYVSYLAVDRPHRGLGLGGRLLDDALQRLAAKRVQVVFSAASRTNRRSIRLLISRGFRPTRRRELGWRDGGLGAWGLRSRMHVVAGEVVLALRLRPPSAHRSARRPRRGSRGTHA